MPSRHVSGILPELRASLMDERRTSRRAGGASLHRSVSMPSSPGAVPGLMLRMCFCRRSMVTGCLSDSPASGGMRFLSRMCAGKGGLS